VSRSDAPSLPPKIVRSDGFVAAAAILGKARADLRGRSSSLRKNSSAFRAFQVFPLRHQNVEARVLVFGRQKQEYCRSCNSEKALDISPGRGETRCMTPPKDEASQPVPAVSEEVLRRFGSRIKRRRRALGWNQKELAERTSIQPSRLSRLERGQAVPRLEDQFRLKAALGGSLDDLLFDPEPSASCLAQLLRELEESATAEELDLLCRMLRHLTHGIRCDKE
jgi:transcriptional regulator with XRE-family HTH domain